MAAAAAAKQADALDTAPARGDFPLGFAGDLKYQRARNAFLAKTRGKSPAPAGAATSSTGMKRGTEVFKSDKPMGGNEVRETITSSTPASDAQEKAKRFETLDDNTLLTKAKGGDFEAKAEAQKRYKKGNKSFSDFEHYGE